VFKVAVNLTSEKWDKSLATGKSNRKRDLLILKIQSAVSKRIMLGYMYVLENVSRYVSPFQINTGNADNLLTPTRPTFDAKVSCRTPRKFYIHCAYFLANYFTSDSRCYCTMFKTVRNLYKSVITPDIVRKSNSIELNPWIELDSGGQSNEIEHRTLCDFDFRTNRINRINRPQSNSIHHTMFD